MPAVLVRHKVRDYATWKVFFDEHEPLARQAVPVEVGYSGMPMSQMRSSSSWSGMISIKPANSSSRPTYGRLCSRLGWSISQDIYFLEEAEAIPV